MLSEQEFTGALDWAAVVFREGSTREWVHALRPIALGGSPEQWDRALAHLRQLERASARRGRPRGSRTTSRPGRRSEH